ncbi:stalk domain-containing protein [Dethiothermospora halolimnae]|uniref:stalk domain-containing protein n=1 Tax=Dethiothermospora halolimnae TaxID=3114390 RepID=UPI003CCC1696
MKKSIYLLLLVLTLFTGNKTFADSYLMHTVKPNDSYLSISEKYNVDVNNLKDLNESLVVNNLIRIKSIFNSNPITIKINNKLLNLKEHPYIENSRVFIPVRFVTEALDIDDILWDGNNKSVTLINNTEKINLSIGSNIAIVNERVVSMDAPINLYNNRTYAPLRFISEIFDYNVDWNENNHSVNITTNKNNDDSEDLYWLSRLVHAEAQGEPFDGKLAVANVIINRTRNDDFPNTIKKVIFDNKYGYQYTPVVIGTIYDTPSAESIEAARMALEGNNNIGNCLYFLNPRKSTNNWIEKNRSFYTSIALHDFYK